MNYIFPEMLRSILNFPCPGKIFTAFLLVYSPFFVSLKSFENFHLTWRLQSAFLLCNSATSTDRFHLKLLQLIQTNVQRAFFKRWSLVKQLNLFFLQSIVRRIMSMSLYEIGSESSRQALIYSCLKIVKVTVFPALIKPSWMKNLYQIFRSN